MNIETSTAPSEETLAKIVSGEIPDPALQLGGEELARLQITRTCPRDGRTMSERDNPRIPGLNREIYCSCGFAFTT